MAVVEPAVIESVTGRSVTGLLVVDAGEENKQEFFNSVKCN